MIMRRNLQLLEAGALAEMNARQTAFSAIKALSLCALLALPLPVPAADKELWRNLKGGALRTLLQDHEFGDGVHFAYRFRSDGTFRGMEMGRVEQGTWRIVTDELCWKWTRPPGPEECYQVQQDGAHLRLMLNGSEAWYGMLKKVR